MSTISSIVFLAGWRVASHISRIDAAEEAINELHEQRVVLARDTDIRWYPAIEQNSLSIHLISLFSIQYHTVDCIPTVVSYIRSPGCILTACISLPLCWSLFLDNKRTHRCTQTHFLSFFDNGQANAYNLYNACKCMQMPGTHPGTGRHGSHAGRLPVSKRQDLKSGESEFQNDK